MKLSFFRFDLNTRKFFIFLTTLYCLYVLPIILADRYYNDDLSRALKGVTGWNGDGRPLTDLLIRFLTFGRPAVDISPLPLILSVLVLSWCVTLYFREHISGFDGSPIFLIGGFGVIANPFLLPDLSYKYDCISIILSIAVCFAVFSLPELNIVPDTALKAAAALAVLCLFQPSAGIFFSLVFPEIFFRALEGKEFLRRSIASLLGLAAALVIYTAVIAPAFVDPLGWRAEASSLGLSPETILRVARQLYILFAVYYEGLPKAVLAAGVILGALLLFGTAAFVRKAGEKKKGRTALTVFALLLPFVSGAAGLSPLMVLRSARISEHMLTAVSVPLMLMGLYAVYLKMRLKTFSLLLACLCILFVFSYSFTYGNALKCQKVYETYVTGRIAGDIEDLDPEGECTKICVSGRMPRARQLQLICEKYPQFANVVPVYIYGENWIGTAFLYHFLQVNLVCDDLKEEDKELIASGSPDRDNAIYELYRKGDRIILSFK